MIAESLFVLAALAVIWAVIAKISVDIIRDEKAFGIRRAKRLAKWKWWTK